MSICVCVCVSIMNTWDFWKLIRSRLIHNKTEARKCVLRTNRVWGRGQSIYLSLLESVSHCWVSLSHVSRG